MSVMVHPVQAPCGCRLAADHERGDRLAFCAHGLPWVVAARPVTALLYEVAQAPVWPRGDDGERLPVPEPVQ